MLFSEACVFTDAIKCGNKNVHRTTSHSDFEAKQMYSCIVFSHHAPCVNDRNFAIHFFLLYCVLFSLIVGITSLLSE